MKKSALLLGLCALLAVTASTLISSDSKAGETAAKRCCETNRSVCRNIDGEIIRGPFWEVCPEV